MNKWLILGLLLGLQGNVWADKKALIFTVSEYPKHIGTLRGVRYDAENARQLANAMGVDDKNIVLYKDAQLDLKGMRNALEQFANGVNEGDQVFFYYSGHGGQQVVQGGARCAVGLVSVDGKILLDSELQQFYQKIEGKTSQLLTFVDACFSGGIFNNVVTRSIDEPKITAKFWGGREISNKGLAVCEKPVNVLTRAIDENQPDSGSVNHVYITASRENEISFDEENSGGMVTVAWRQCLKSAPDLDRSGALSVAEIQQCAQKKLEDRLAGTSDFKASNITVRGKRESVFQLIAVAPSAAAIPHQAAASTEQKPIVVASLATQAPSVINLQATLNDLYQSRDERRVVKLKTSKEGNYRLGDALSFEIQSSHSGYVYVLMVGSDNKTFDMLYPNQLATNNFINKSSALPLPSKGWKMRLAEPAGSNRLLVIVSDAPRDFSRLSYQKIGPFSIFNGSASGQYDLQSAMQALSPKQKCDTRTGCTSSYGAALLDITAE
ncbi:MAG: caspase family protein [Proteobacteria bacterium]|nr:caspase family protein [Pseudomonadota bacterium]